MDATTITALRAERSSTENRISGCRTQLRHRNPSPARRLELERYLEHLLERRADLPLELLVAEHDATWNLILDQMVPPPGQLGAGAYKREIAWRNSRGLPKTVKTELRELAEAELVETLERRGDDPRARQLLDQAAAADAATAELERRREQRSGLHAA